MEKSEILKREGMYLSTPSGNSMRPLLRGGKDTVVIRPAPDRLARFDICLYRRPDGKDVLHRVIRVRGACYDIRGDGCDYTEHGVPHGRVIGVMEGFFRGQRYIPVSSCAQRLYARAWNLLYPARWFAMRCWRKARRILKK